MAIPLYERRLKRFFYLLILFIILVFIVSIFSLSIGPAMLDPIKVLQALTFKLLGRDVGGLIDIVAKLRLARTLASIFCGASLALAGLLMQTITRNPLADPYIFGLSSTALTALALGIILAPDLMIQRVYVVTISFIGAMIGFTLTLLLSKLGGGSDIAMVLAGIAVASLFGGVSHILLYIVQSMTKVPYMYLLMGTVSTTLWGDVQLLIPLIIVPITLSLALFKPLNAYLYGDEYAKQLGFNPASIRIFTASISAFLTATTIAFIGVVGFIGLVAPHIARFFVGIDHKFSIPTTIFIGALLTLIADIIVKAISIFIGGLGELPLGVVTAVIGAPFLSYLVIKRMRR